MPEDVEHAVRAMRLSEIPFPTARYVGGPYGIRRAIEAATDVAFSDAARARMWPSGAGVPPDSLRALVDGVLCEIGLGPFEHPRRHHAIRARARLIPKIYALALGVGLGELRNRASSIADLVARGVLPVPRSIDALLAALRRGGLLRAAGPTDLDAEETGRRVLTLGGVRLAYTRGRLRHAIGLKSREGDFLLQAARGRGRQPDATVRCHVGNALQIHGVRIEKRGDVFVTEPGLRVLVTR